jgi:hypothetical protein
VIEKTEERKEPTVEEACTERDRTAVSIAEVRIAWEHGADVHRLTGTGTDETSIPARTAGGSQDGRNSSQYGMCPLAFREQWHEAFQPEWLILERNLQLCRYHLTEFGSRNFPTNARELFNLRHSSLRVTVERAFGALKNRFCILDNKPFHTYKTQVKLVLACLILHN